MKNLTILISILILPALTGATEISFNNLIKKASVKKERLRRDVSELIDDESVSNNATLVGDFADGDSSAKGKSKLVDSEKNTAKGL